MAYDSSLFVTILNAMIAALGAPKDDRFQVISEHTLLIDPTYMGIERSADGLIIQLALNEGRTVEVEKAFYKAVADGLHERVSLSQV
jgi:4-oxalocrotonate tautomerase